MAKAQKACHSSLAGVDTVYADVAVEAKDAKGVWTKVADLPAGTVPPEYRTDGFRFATMAEFDTATAGEAMAEQDATDLTEIRRIRAQDDRRRFVLSGSKAGKGRQSAVYASLKEQAADGAFKNAKVLAFADKQFPKEMARLREEGLLG